MSLTPPEETGDSASVASEDDDPADPSLLARAMDRVRGALGAAGRAVRSGVVAVLDAPAGPNTRSEERFEPTTDDTDDQRTPAQYSLVSDGPDEGSDETDAADESEDERTSPPVVSTADSSEITVFGDELDGPDADRPELEVQWHGDTVTFVSPDEPDARITSDVWEDVDR